jgi:hypothetical protein
MHRALSSHVRNSGSGSNGAVITGDLARGNKGHMLSLGKMLEGHTKKREKECRALNHLHSTYLASEVPIAIRR